MTSDLSCSPLHVQTGLTALYIASWNGHDQIVVLISQARHKMYNDVVITLELYVMLHLVYP